MSQMVGKSVSTVTILAAKSQLTTEDIVNKQKSRKHILNFTLNKQQVKPLFTFYYPYVFSEWKVTVPRYLFRDVKALVRVGVNGLTGVAAQTELWPEYKTVQVKDQYCVPFRMVEENSDYECSRALENFVYKSMRPLKPPIYKLNRKENIFLPYHAYYETSSGKKRLMVTEAITNVTDEARKMKTISEWLEKMARSELP
jgi:hypothetical protein